MRVGLAMQACESKDVAWFHKVATNVEKDLEGQKRKRGHLNELNSVEAVEWMIWIMESGFQRVEDERRGDGDSRSSHV